MNHQSNSKSIRAVLAGVVLLCVGLPWSLGASAAPVAVGALSFDVAAAASAPAERLGVLAPDNFPMEVSPRCYVLNNFGDDRSGGRSHAGVDILATLGQDIYAMADGTITVQTIAGASNATLSGNLLRVTHTSAGGTYTTYGHLSAFAPGITKGSVVHKGQLIGFVGDTGNPGPGNYHLHYEIHPGGGAAVDPLPTLLPVPAGCTIYW